MSEHRWQIPCELSPDEAEFQLAEDVERVAEEALDGAEPIEHIETVGFFGWTLRLSDGRAVGVSVPQPGGPDKLVVRSEHEELGQQAARALVDQGPLEGRDVHYVDRG